GWRRPSYGTPWDRLKIVPILSLRSAAPYDLPVPATNPNSGIRQVADKFPMVVGSPAQLNDLLVVQVPSACRSLQRQRGGWPTSARPCASDTNRGEQSTPLLSAVDSTDYPTSGDQLSEKNFHFRFGGPCGQDRLVD